MTETETPERTREQDVRDLIAQVHAGILLCEEILDEEQPGWQAKRTKRRDEGVGGRAFGIRATLHPAWINLGHLLINDLGAEPWSIAPLAMRGDGQVTIWQYGQDGLLDLSHDDDQALLERPVPPAALREITWKGERLYTLAQAREILESCVEHQWEVVTDADGTPVEVRCALPECVARRPVG